MTYYYGGYDRHGYNKRGYDRDGYDKYGRDCDGYDRGGYDCDGYNKYGRDCDGYDKSGYDCDGYDRGGYDCDGYDRDGCDCDGNPADGEPCEIVEVTLLTENFDGTCSTPDTSDQVVSDGGWLKYYDAAYADGRRDGEMVFASVDASELDTVTISFDMAVGDVCKWEADGRYADDVTVSVMVDGVEVVLDVFVRDGDKLVGSETGQVVTGSWSDLTYTIDGGAEDLVLKIDADISASDEYLWVDTVSITGEEHIYCEPEPEPCVEEVTTTLLVETFDGTCVNPDGSENVVSDGGWLNYYDSAYTDGCRDGSLVFAELDTADCETVEISFDMAVGNICNWEAVGECNGDAVTVEVKLDGAWVVLDVFSRDGYALVGSETGQVVADGAWSDVSYSIDGGAADLQLRITSDISAQDEHLWLDNVEITCVELVECDPEPEPCDSEPDCTSATFVIEGEIDTEFTLTEQEDGTLLVEVKQLAGDTVGDLRGLFFDIEDESLLDGMSIVGDEVTAAKIAEDGVTKVTRGVNIKGDVLNEYGAFDIGVAIGESGMTDDIREVSFVLTSTSGPIEVEDFENMDVGVRYQSVGEEGGSREDSLKIGGNSGEFVCDCPLGSLGDYVWVDADLDGQQGADEAGVVGVSVELFLDGVSTGRTTTTDEDGFYLFEGLEAGDYNVVFTAIPEGYAFTLQNLGDDAADSDVDLNGVSDTITLAEGEHYRDLDAGIYDLSSVVVLGSLGDTVWYDTDRDGIQDADETGVEGVEVALLLDGVATGATTTTDANGYYVFEELEAGNYSVQFTAIPEGYEFTAADQGGDNLADSDADASGLSETYALAEGEDYMGLDAGIVVTLPSVADDEFKICWNEVATVDVLGNDDAGLTITEVDGQAISVGTSVTTGAGAIVTLNADGTLSYDGVEAWAALEFGTTGTETFTYTAVNALGGEATGSVGATVCANNIKTLEDINEIMPDLIEFTIDDLSLDGGEGFLVDVNVVDTGDAEVDASNDRFELTASTDVYCVDIAGTVLDDVTLDAELFLADENDASLGAYVQNVENLDLVTYILNQDYVSQGYSVNDIQSAIWNLTDDFFILFEPNASAIVADAQANGEGFEAGEGDLVGLIIAPVQETDPVSGEETNYQNFIYGVEYQTFSECLCV